MIETWQLAGGTLTFEEETHTYWFNGQKCISVTQILHKLFPTKYSGIDSEVLKKAANRGTVIHNAIEVYETLGLERTDLQEFRDYVFLKNYFKFIVKNVEIPIVIIYKDLIIAGRLDMILAEPIDDTFIYCISDNKTTAQLDKVYLSCQESLYKYGYSQSYPDGYKIDGLRAIHLRKGVRKYVVVDEIDPETILDKYIKLKEEENNGEIN